LVTDLFQSVAITPAVQELRRRVEGGRALSLRGVDQAAHPFLAVLLRRLYPSRPLLVVTAGVKAQESVHQDIGTWLNLFSQKPPTPARGGESASLFFYPAWEILPHESKLPHADVISERLETLVALSGASQRSAPVIVTNVVALAQRTFAPGDIEKQTRSLTRGQRIDPLDLIEWLEDHGY
jgi:transcription-repair coupling factor (superfamily II helicase)